MKKCFFFLVLVFAIVSVLCSCSQDVDSKLIGSWIAEDGSIVLTFGTNKVLTVTYPSDPSESISYMYTIEKGVVILDMGFIKRPMDYSISGNTLTLDGDKYYKQFN